MEGKRLSEAKQIVKPAIPWTVHVMPGACGTISLALTVLFVVYMATLAPDMAYPRACKAHGCFQALLNPNPNLTG